MSHDPSSPSESVSVVNVPERQRFEISVDGTFAGFTEYVDGTGDHAGERTFPHTVIEEEFGGRGLSTLLIQTALDAARVADLAVLPQCSAVAGFIAKHDDYADLVPEGRRGEFGL
jgi:predicted GNAT family acetyltransferase